MKLRTIKKQDKRASLFDIIIWLVAAFVTLIFFAGFMYGFGILNSSIQDIGIDDTNFNVTSAGQDTFTVVNTNLGALRWLGLVIIVGMFLGIMVSNFLVKAHPVFFIVYIGMTIIAVVLSVYLSNAYETILTSGNVLAPTLQSFTGLNYILLKLPIWTTVVGIMGALFLFLGITFDREAGGSVPI